MQSLSKKSKVAKLYLFINTSSPDAAEFIITDHESALVRKKRTGQQERFDLFHSLVVALKRLKRPPSTIACIYVVEGPGMFSHLRTGISLVQSWQYVFSVPIKALSTHEFPRTKNDAMLLIRRRYGKMRKGLLLPRYGSEPSITIKKS